MTRIQKSALVQFSALQMIRLVEDIASYPEFLPWCSGSTILKRDGSIVEAELRIAKAGFQQSFTTRNTSEGTSRLLMNLLHGPFSSLEGVWNFVPLRENASKISLDLEFEIQSRFVHLALGRIFNQICNTMVASFTQRAKYIHGK